MRVHYYNAVEIIMCTAVLHNIAVRWNDQDQDLPDDHDPVYHNHQQYNHRDDWDFNDAARRLRDRREGEQVRDNLTRFQPPPTNRELRIM